MSRALRLVAPAALVLALGCTSDEDAANPIEAPAPTVRADDERLDTGIEALRDLLVELALGPCSTTTTGTTPTTAPAGPTIEDLLDALGLGTVPPPTCTPAPEVTP